jgi:hypothetical protein
MAWTGVVWREAGNYGPGGMFESQQNLGRHAFGVQPEVGDSLEIGGEEYRVVSVDVAFCHVRPTKMKPIA